MSIHLWLLFTLIDYWLAISEEMSLKSIISLLLNQIPWISFSWSKSSNQVQSCINWKDIEFQASNKYQEFWFLRWYHPMLIISISFLFTSAPQVFPKFLHNFLSCQNWSIRFCKPDCLVLNTGYVRPFSPDSSKIFQTCSVILPDMSGFSAKISIWIKIFIFGLSPIYFDLCDHVKISRYMNMEWIVDKEDLSWTISLCVILSKVIFYRFLEEVQVTKICSSNLRSHLLKILPGSLLKIFILSNPHPRCWSKFSWTKKNSHGYLSQNSIFQEFLIPCGPCPYSWLWSSLTIVFKPTNLLESP
jgi:hypothetical protein